MSIIYKALQKTQKNRESYALANTEEYDEDKLSWRKLAPIITIIFLLIVIAVESYMQYKHYATKKVVATQAPVIPLINESDFKNHYTLNGIFASDQNKIAMINNQYLHVGDSIGGMKIVNIGDNDVVLQNDKQIFVLRVPI